METPAASGDATGEASIFPTAGQPPHGNAASTFQKKVADNRFSALQALGLSVIPLRVGAKVAEGSWKHAQVDAATAEQARNWDNTDCNVGVVTGSLSGVTVVDFDNPEAYAEAKRRGLIPATRTVTTPRGFHTYFLHEQGIRNSAGKVAGLPGVDVRGDGGYVVAPGSDYEPTEAERNEGKVAGHYGWAPGLSPDEVPLAKMPDPLRALLMKPKQADGGGGVERAATGDARIDAALRRVREAAPGTRNETLNREAFWLGQRAASAGWDQADVQSRLAAAAADAGLFPDEVEFTISSGWRAGVADPVEEPSEPEAPSEHAVALEFTRQYGADFLYDHSIGAWFRWDGCRWCEETTGLAFDYCRRIAAASGGGRAMQKASTVAGAERFARHDRAHAVLATGWDPDLYLLGTPSGTVNLQNGKLKLPDRADRITKLAGFAPKSGKAKLWLEALSQWTGGDHEVMRFVQQWCGYCLTGDISEHQLLFIYGNGGNGKSVFLNVLSAVLGDYAMTAGMETFTASRNERHTTELARLRGARIVTASEIEDGREFNTARIKTVTGGDPITARKMRQDDFTYQPQFKLVFVANDQPRLHSVDDAMRRRINMLPFLLKPEAPDRRLEAKLKAEGGQILAWMMEGCLNWQATRGDGTEKQQSGLTRPDAVKVATDDYFEGQDVFGSWISESCILGAGRFEQTTALYLSWVRYAKDNGEEPGTQTAFSLKLGKRFKKGKVADKRGFSGLYLGVPSSPVEEPF